MNKKGKGSACGKAIKGTARREAGTPCKGKSIGKKVEEDRGRRGSVCGQAIRGIARVEEEFSSRVEEKSKGALW